MNDDEIVLRKVSAKCFRCAKHWHSGYLAGQLGILVLSVLALFIGIDPFVSVALGLVCVVAIEGLRWSSDLWKSDGELFKREWELCAGLGGAPSGSGLADWLADKPHDFLNDVTDDEIRGSEFDSRAEPGPRRIVENVEESSWWSKHECRRVSQILLVSLLVLFALGIGVLVVNLGALRHSASAGDLAHDIAVARNIGGVVCAVFTIVFSINVVRLLTEFREFASQAGAVFQKCGALLSGASISERDALLVLHQYQNARSAAPLIPTRIWRQHGDHLRVQWRRVRPGGGN